MDERSLVEIISQGENAAVEFKSAAARPESLAREMVAFCNTLGGTLLIGVEDDGSISGVEAQRYEEHVANMMLKSMKEDVDFNEIGELFRVTFSIGHAAEGERQDLIPDADSAS